MSEPLYAGNVGFIGPIDPPAIDVIGLKSAPRGVADVDVDAVDTALGNRGRVGGTEAPLDGGCIPGGIPGIPDIIPGPMKGGPTWPMCPIMGCMGGGNCPIGGIPGCCGIPDIPPDITDELEFVAAPGAEPNSPSGFDFFCTGSSSPELGEPARFPFLCFSCSFASFGGIPSIP